VWSLRARSWESPAVSTLANGEYASSPMVLAGAYVYWCEEDRIARVSVSGGSVERFASSNGRCASIDGDAQRIVWSTNDGLIHEKAPASHGDAQKVVTLDAGYWSLTLAGDSVIAVDTPRAVRISLAKRTQVALEGLDAPFTIAGNDVYRVDTYLVPGPYNPKNGAYGSNGYAIVRTSLDPAAPRTRLADAQANPSNLQVVGEHLYWTDGGIYEQDVALHRLRLPDGKAEIVVVIPWSSGGHAYDQRRVVWHDGDTHQIKALLH